MHRGHDHHHHDGGSGVGGVGIGHNHSAARQPVQWQTPHRPETLPAEHPPQETDLDLVEAAFVEGFLHASDVTSFLRLARVPFEALAADGAKLVLLRVEVESLADMGAVSPHVGGGSFRYDPLPARLVSRRQRLRLIYFDGENLRAMSLAEASAIASGK